MNRWKIDTLLYDLLNAVQSYSQYLNVCQTNFHKAKHMCHSYYANPTNSFSLVKETNVSILFGPPCMRGISVNWIYLSKWNMSDVQCPKFQGFGCQMTRYSKVNHSPHPFHNFGANLQLQRKLCCYEYTGQILWRGKNCAGICQFVFTSSVFIRFECPLLTSKPPFTNCSCWCV